MRRTDEHYERVQALKAKLKALTDAETGEPDWQDNTAEPVPCYSLVLGDNVTTVYGGCSIEVVANDDSVTSTTFNFRVDLGPVNAQKLIDFLKTLPDEPEEEQVHDE